MSGTVILIDDQMAGVEPGGGSRQGPRAPTSHLGGSRGCRLAAERLRLPYRSPSRVAAARSPSERTRGVSRQREHWVPTSPAQLAALTFRVPAEQEEANQQQQQQQQRDGPQCPGAPSGQHGCLRTSGRGATPGSGLHHGPCGPRTRGG